MPFPQEPFDPANSDVDKVRLRVGDFDPLEVELTYELYVYFLSVSGGNVNQAALMAVKALIAKYSRAMDESTDEVSASFTQRLEGYYTLELELLKTLANFTPYAGGLSRRERVEDVRNNDLRDNPFIAGSAQGTFSSPHKHQWW